jgi:FkbM family methyltransferase
MTGEPLVAQTANELSAVAAFAFAVEYEGRKIELVVPEEDGVRYVANEVFKGQCYKSVPGVAPPSTVLDIGANVGLAATYFRMIYPDALIHCVEPDPVASRFLARNAQRIGNCRIHAVGLYEGDCERPYYSANNSVLSSLTRNPIADAKPEVLQLRDAGRFVARLGVERFDVIKIDTEGAELPILRSLGSIVRDAAIVHIEFHSRDDRRAIDDLMNPTHCLFRGEIEGAHRGHFTYVANVLLSDDVTQAPLSLDG